MANGIAAAFLYPDQLVRCESVGAIPPPANCLYCAPALPVQSLTVVCKSGTTAAGEMGARI